MSDSGQRRELARLRIVVGNLAAVREERVYSLRRAIASGAYRPDPLAVARAVLRDLAGDVLA